MAGTRDSISAENSLVGTLYADNAMNGTVGTAYNPTYALVNEAGAQIVLFINNADYKMYAQLKDKYGNLIYTSNIIDLPLESVVMNGRYDSATKEVVLTLVNGNEIRFSVEDLVRGLVDEDRLEEVLGGYWSKEDLTEEDIEKWNDKQDYLNQGENVQIYSDLNLKGNTSQYSTTGKNMFNKANTTSDKRLDPSGKLTSAEDYFVSDFIKVTGDTIYTKNSPTTDAYHRVCFYTSNDQTTFISKDDSNNTFTTPATCEYLRFCGLLTELDTTQLEVGSQESSFEPYTGNLPSPNPSYPQPINVVSGDNNIVICGKNLFDEEYETGYININTGENTGTTNVRTKNYTRILPNTQYTISGENARNTYIIYYDKNKTYISYEMVKSNAKSGTFTTPNNSNIYYAKWYDAVSTGDIPYWQLEKGNQASTYEAYQSQTYPIYLGVENLFDKDNITIINAYINQTSGITTSEKAKTTYIACKPNTTYTISKRNDGSNNRFTIATSTNTPALNVSISQYQIDNNASQMTITTNATANYLCMTFYHTDETTLTMQQVLDSIQIEKGSKANHYTPYGTTPIELCKIGDYQDGIYKSTGKNLWGGFTYTSSNNGVTFTQNIDGSVYANGTATNISSITVTNLKNNNIYKQLQPGTYTISKDSSLVQLQAYNVDTTTLVATVLTSETSKSFTITEAQNITVRVVVPSGTAINKTIFIQVEQNNQATDFKPYGIVWYVKKQVGKVVLDGSEDGWANDSTGYLCGIINNDVKRNTSATTIAEGYCNYYVPGTLNNSRSNTNQYSIYSGSTNTSLYFNNNSMSLNDFKNWLSTHNTIVYYVLATPENILLNDTLQKQLNNLSANLSNNWIENIVQENNDLPFIINYDNTKLTIDVPCAGADQGGVIKTSDSYATATADGVLTSQTKTYAQYNSLTNNAFVSKGTLENVITGKGLVSNSIIKNTQSTTAGDVYDVRYINSLIGDINSALDSINGEVI